ncbi:transporter [Lithospermum erythrorhizon]|uniref:Transporter n=1 Tax=Lithospermum erythrorhizon TaxID=34254 RepID=A0AAV3RX10_LITER
MAYRRYISTHANQFYKQKSQRFAPLFSNILNSDNNKHSTPTKYSSICPKPSIYSLISPKASIFSNNCPIGSLNRSNYLFQKGYGFEFSRNMSKSVGGDDESEMFVESVMVQADEAVNVQAATAVNEVASAAADSFFPVAGLQYLIDYVHILTGLNWWASIAATTFLIRWLTLPLIINQLKATSKFTLLRPKLEEVKNEMQDKGMSSEAVAEGQAKMQALFKEYKVTPFTPLKGLLIQGPVFICFFLAVKNMAEKVPSFQQGGAYWFLDLTTPDPMYILPVLTALTFWITVECNMQEGMEGNPAAKTIKNVSRGFAVLTVPLTASFPKAIFCYWITSNVFSLMYGLVIRRPEVKKLFGIPIIPVTPAPTDQQPGFSFFDAIKKYAAAQVESKKKAQMQIQQQPLPSESPDEAPKLGNKKPSSSAVLSQRLKSLEKEVKGRKKGKKR